MSNVQVTVNEVVLSKAYGAINEDRQTIRVSEDYPDAEMKDFISINATCTVNFSETEKRLNIGFNLKTKPGLQYMVKFPEAYKEIKRTVEFGFDYYQQTALIYPEGQDAVQHSVQFEFVIPWDEIRAGISDGASQLCYSSIPKENELLMNAFVDAEANYDVSNSNAKNLLSVNDANASWHGCL